MNHKKVAMLSDKKIALVAHDNKKWDLVQWAKFNRDLLAHHTVFATGTTGVIIEKELGLKVTKLQSGPHTRRVIGLMTVEHTHRRAQRNAIASTTKRLRSP